jgi:uncharacterized protein (DUF362 family)/NAD-dependent dihydropyrimidine dehydrogenase PreA subunit
MKTKVVLARCPNYSPELVDASVNRAVDLLGGIEDIIKPNSKVLIKPNLLTDSQPQDCITTHPRVVESIIRLVKKTNSKIYVGDSPSVFGQKRDFDRVYEMTGMREVCDSQNVEMVYFDRAILKNGIPLTDWIERCDYIISVPKFKTHGLTKLTAGIKNLFGLVLGMHKIKLHKECFKIDDFSRMLVDIFELVKPTLTIVDAVVSMEGDGPGSAGTKTDTGLILASLDAVAIDSILATIMGILPEDVPTTKEAGKRNLGESDLHNIDVIGENLGEFIYSDFKLPKTSFISSMPRPLLKIAQGLIWHKMEVDRAECKGCQRCVEVCPAEAIRREGDKALIDPLRCILCSCCQEICPHNAVTFKKSLLLKLIGV